MVEGGEIEAQLDPKHLEDIKKILQEMKDAPKQAAPAQPGESAKAEINELKEAIKQLEAAMKELKIPAERVVEKRIEVPVEKIKEVEKQVVEQKLPKWAMYLIAAQAGAIALFALL
jgi:hypothetical protein